MTVDSGQSRELSPLKQAFLRLQEAEARIRQLNSPIAEPVAIVGMGCRIPGAEHGPDSFWRLLRDKRCSISAGLEQRLSVLAGAVHLPESARWAALLDHVDLFDAQHFGISPREAAAIDPQQRILLEVSWQALEHAGIDPASLYQTATGVYVGISSHDYAHLQIRGRSLGNIDPHFASGTAASIAAGRISYVLGLNGPAMSIDTACSSSLVAVHLACEALRRRECSAALAGGVNLILAPEASVAFAQAGVLSSRGICSPFDAAADGFVRGEGCGIVVLKRLEVARAAGDRILAVILGSAVNQDGASSGLTAPSGLAQQALLREAHRRAGIEPSQVGYVEVHGTATKLGDPIEAQALGAVFAANPQKLRVGSVKSNIGHLESASGIAGLIRVVLSLEHGEIPGQIHWTAPSEHLPWQDLPLEVKPESGVWQLLAGRRIAGISAFGFCGTNAHILLEDYPKEPGPLEPEAVDVLTISARTEAALRQTAREYAALLRETEWHWNEICHTAGVGRASMAERLAIVAPSRRAAAQKLDDWLRGANADGVFRGTAKTLHRESAGQGRQASPETIADRFVHGRSIDWTQRGSGKKFRRAVLPTCVFQRERYWFEEQTSHALPASEPMPAAPLRPGGPGVTPDLRLLLAEVPAERRLTVIRSYLQAETAKVLGMNRPEEVDPDRPLMELGMDSMIALELKNHLQQSSGVTLPGNFLFGYPTIGRAAVYLNATVGVVRGDVRSQPHSTEQESLSL